MSHLDNGADAPQRDRCDGRHHNDEHFVDAPEPIKNLISGGFKLVATYPYFDETNVFRCEKLRFEYRNGQVTKTFRWRRPDDKGGWLYSRDNSAWLPYRLSALIAAPGQAVHLAEGEKDVDRLADADLLASFIETPSGTDLRPFAGRTVYIHRDNDETGREKGEKLARMLHGIASAIYLLDYSDLPPGGDVSDWLDAGHTRAELVARCKHAVAWQPQSDPDANVPSFVDGLTEIGLAIEFAEQQDGKRLYDCGRGSWRVCDPAGIWRKDETLSTVHAVQAMLETVRDHRLHTQRKVKSVEELARSQPSIATLSLSFDGDAYILGTPRGPIDLRTGRLLRPDPALRISMATACAPSAATAKRWLTFLDETTGGDKTMMRFLQQIAGYSLTGDVSEQCLFFLYGSGGNGKGVFVRALAGVLGSYAHRAPIAAFAAGPDKHPTTFAAMAGKRLVYSSETEQARNWAAARIKDMTGGDPINARFMRQDEFVFDPTFKVLVSGNYEPAFESIDDGMRRRFHVLPFEKRFSSTKDRQLDEKLKAEWPSILHWAIEGCLDWQENGLLIPDRVKMASESYFERQDTFRLWLESEVVQGPGLEDTSTRLFNSWKAFAEGCGEARPTQKAFAEKLKRAEFQGPRVTKRDGKSVRIWTGLKALTH